MTIDAAGVRAARFAATKFREGYDQDEVDELLDRAAAALDVVAAGGVPDLTADEVLSAKFQATKFREGYDQDEVDDFLDRVVAALRVVDGHVSDEEAPAPLVAAQLRVELARLRPRRMRPGYAPDEVTDLLEKAAFALESQTRGFRPSPTADELAAAGTRFTVTPWWAPGLDRTTVDGLVERAAQALHPSAPTAP
ncbi:DivIVA domain-containing protein [Cellulomonas marina]|uniref:Cell wall synthesis protein Wag31 n=1 Tax=Cellulomonas marina TaxID=988821 RepID=A0A1I0X975_9CELL|nr:hypothetical protein Cma02nite_21230 [Cellulomonas marina]SFA97481.1 DivIVA domain-containing protein [Cellulomonas marina]